VNEGWEVEKKEIANQLADVEAGIKKKEPELFMKHVVLQEELSFGDAGLNLRRGRSGLGGAAILAVGTREQKLRFLRKFTEGKPKWGAMAITEPGAGSDTANITTTARREGDSWVLNGEKIFVTSGLMAARESGGLVVVWATVDKTAGRAGIKSFVVEAGTPGMTVTKVEDKLGIRCSDTASIVFEDCRIPLENVLGSPEVQDKAKTAGFKGAMATFDATRPTVAASAIGVGRAALEFVREVFQKEGIPIRYGNSPHNLKASEKDFMEMEANLHAARLLTWRAACLLDAGKSNNLEASMAKAKAGLAVTRVAQKAVELLGPLGYSRRYLLEKWMRDAKINDIFEGTGQINMLIVARRILGFSSKQLK
jgi:acyl-CoA dehydrogenase